MKKHIRVRCYAHTNHTRAKARSDGEYEAQAEISDYADVSTLPLVALPKNEHVEHVEELCRG